MLQRIKLTLAYLGTEFAGWQRQPGQRTVQGEIEAALARILGGAPPAVVGAGRTDAGVHARGQVAHLDVHPSLPAEALQRALNATLPPDVRVRRARTAGPSFHARFGARAKHYAHRVHWGPQRLPWAALRSAEVRLAPDLAAVHSAVEMLVGRHDVASFTVPAATRGSTVRTLFRVRLEPGRSALTIHFLGDGFLRYQVRRMVGAVLEVGWHRRTPSEFRELLESPRAGTPVETAPARGLTLERVLYRPGRMVDSVPLG